MGLLIQHGGDIHIESDLGETAIQVAQRMCPEVLTKLVELGVEAAKSETAKTKALEQKLAAETLALTRARAQIAAQQRTLAAKKRAMARQRQLVARQLFAAWKSGIG